MRLRLLLLGSLIAMSACGSASTDSTTTTEVSTSTSSTNLSGVIPPSTTVKKQTTTTVPKCANPATKGSLVVMAASSMSNVFTDVQSRVLEEYPCITGVTYSYGSSATLAAQIVNGSPADVFVSASEATMNTVKNAGKTLSVDNFAKNVGEIMVSSNSKFDGRITDIGSLTDAVNAGIKVGLCVATAPCGSLANTILKNVNITRGAVADTESPSVEDLVTKIQMGELDAGIVYHSDCQYAEPRGLAKCVAIPDAVNATTGYYVAALTPRPIVQQYVNYINGSSFKTTLQLKFGFLAP